VSSSRIISASLPSCCKNYQNWWKFDKVLTKTILHSFLRHGVQSTEHKALQIAKFSCLSSTMCWLDRWTGSWLTDNIVNLLIAHFHFESFHRASYASAVLAVVILSVCHTRALWQTKQSTVDILIPHERAITVVFWHQQWLAGDGPFRLKFALKVTHPLQKIVNINRFSFTMSQEIAKKFNYDE